MPLLLRKITRGKWVRSDRPFWVAADDIPADSMKDNSSTLSGTKSPGASQYTPGHEQKKPGGASELSPGDKMNDARGKGGR